MKCLGGVKNFEVEAHDAKEVADFHVMLIGLGSCPNMLDRPWLCAMGAIYD